VGHHKWRPGFGLCLSPIAIFWRVATLERKGKKNPRLCKRDGELERKSRQETAEKEQEG